MKRIKNITKFCIIGFFCFILDLSFSLIFFKFLGLPKTFVRYPAWLIAVSSSYFLNLNFTFISDKKSSIRRIKKFERYIFYISSQALGGIINICSYSLLIFKFNFSIFSSILIGTFMGLVFNYFGAKYILKRNYI